MKISECLTALKRFEDRTSPLLRQLLEQQPQLSRAHALLGSALNAIGLTDEAEKQLRSSLAIAPKQPDVLVALAGIYLQKKQNDLADAAFNQAKSMEPKSTQLLDSMGWA